MMTETHLFNKDHVIFFGETEKTAILDLMARHAFDLSLVSDPKAFFAELIRREKMGTTGVGRGVALPHAARPDIADLFVIAGIAEKPVNWQSLDTVPVRAIFLIGCPGSPAAPEAANSRYLQLVARLMLLIKDEKRRRAILTAQSREALMDIIEL